MSEQVIVRVGGEGGVMKLCGRRTSRRTWQFRVVVDCGTLLDLDDSLSPDEVRQETGWVDSWSAALGLLDKHPWTRLRPVAIHNEFASKVMAAVKARLDRSKDIDHITNWQLVAERDRSKEE